MERYTYKQYVEWMISIGDIPLSREQWRELVIAINEGRS